MLFRPAHPLASSCPDSFRASTTLRRARPMEMAGYSGYPERVRASPRRSGHDARTPCKGWAAVWMPGTSPGKTKRGVGRDRGEARRRYSKPADRLHDALLGGDDLELEAVVVGHRRVRGAEAGDGSVEIVEGLVHYLGRDLGAEAAARPRLVDGQSLARLSDNAYYTDKAERRGPNATRHVTGVSAKYWALSGRGAQRTTGDHPATAETGW